MSPRTDRRASIVLPARRFGIALLVLLAALFGLGLPARAQPLLVLDMDSLEVLHAEQAGLPWHPASLTKLMTAFVAFEQIALGHVGLDTPVIVSANAARQPPSNSGLPVDSALSLRDALYVLVVKSANDIATAIAETVGGSEAGFVAMMNDAARRMGLGATHFVNPHGLHNAAQVTSARDMALLALYLVRTFPQYGDMFRTETVTLGRFTYESQNALLTGFAGATGFKTGFVCASGLNLVGSAERGGRRLMVVVLGAPSARERNERAAMLLIEGFAGRLSGAGQTIVSLANATGAAPADLRARVCGTEARDYLAAREAAFPYGLAGQPSFLADEVSGLTYAATDLGRIRVGVPMPRPRPDVTFPSALTAETAPAAVLAFREGAQTVPFPMPRPPGR